MHFNKKSLVSFLVWVMLNSFGISALKAQESMSSFIQSADTVIVYKNVPGQAPSDKYTIRVRSAASNNEWVDCFANNSQNLAYLQTPVSGAYGATRNYSDHTDGWSHTYANIEMGKNKIICFKNKFLNHLTGYEIALAFMLKILLVLCYFKSVLLVGLC